MAKVIDVYKDNDGHVEQSNYMLEIKNLMRIAENIWFVRFTRYSYFFENDEARLPDGERQI